MSGTPAILETKGGSAASRLRLFLQMLFVFFVIGSVTDAFLAIVLGFAAFVAGVALPVLRPRTDPRTRAVAAMMGLAIAGVAAADRAPTLALVLGAATIVLVGALSRSGADVWAADLGLLVVLGLAAGGADGSLISAAQPQPGQLIAALVVLVLLTATAVLPATVPADHTLDGSAPKGRPGYLLVTLPALVMMLIVATFAAGMSPTFDRSSFSIEFGRGDGEGAPRRDHPGLNGVLDAGDNPTLSDEVVLRVTADAELYWRGMTYNAYDGRYWYDTLDRQSATFPAGGTRMSSAPIPGESVQVAQTFELEQSGLDVFLGASRIESIYYDQFDGTYGVLDDVIIPADRLPAGATWTVISSVRLVDEADLRAADTSGAFLPDHLVEIYANEDNVSPETAALAREITADATTTYDKVAALEDWFDANVEYDRWDAASPDGVDPVDHLLFGIRRGYCEQIASAMTVMLRSLGIPARIVVGYIPGERDTATGQWLSRGSDAHAWTEVYFPGIGWQAFDPTSGVPLSANAFDVADAEHPLAVSFEQMVVALGVAVVGLAAVAALLSWRNHRRHLVRLPRPQRRLDALGERLELDWTASHTLRDRLDDLRRAGVDPEVVDEAGRSLERAAFAPDPEPTPSSRRKTPLDGHLDALEEAVENRRKDLVG